MKIRLNNTKKGLTTIWSLEKFQSALEQMRELYQVLLTEVSFNSSCEEMRTECVKVLSGALEEGTSEKQ